MLNMIAVELAVKKVKKLSNGEARELLDWMAKRQPKRASGKTKSAVKTRKKSRRSMRDLIAWYDSIRGTTDWEPPRMPDDLVKSIRL